MRTSGAHIALAIALCASMSVAARARVDDAAPNGLGRVQTHDPSVEALIAAGAQRSVTLRDLIDRLGRTRWVVFVQRGRCPDAFRYRGVRGALGGPPACLIGRVGTYYGNPYLIVRIDTRRSRTPDQEISLIAHELQHALEAAEAPDVTDSESLQAFFRRTGKISFQAPGLIGYETGTALQIGRQVTAELRRVRRQEPIADAPQHASCSATRRASRP